MTNYYEELKLNKSDSLDEIQKQLSQLESTWKRREITNPEKATKMLALLVDARKVFKDSNTRSEYEKNLANNLSEPKTTDPNEERHTLLKKWYRDADDYFQNGESDLAQSAIEKALEFIDPLTEDPKIFDLAAQIYRDNHHYVQALNYVNKAIVLEPTVGNYYLTKGIIISDQALQATVNGKYLDANALTQLSRDNIKTAISKARMSGDNITLGNALGVLAFSLYKNNPVDEQQAEQLALEAASVGESWNNSKRVLDEISARREATEKAEKERLDRERREYEERQERERLAELERARNREAIQKQKEELTKATRQRALVFTVIVVIIMAVSVLRKTSIKSQMYSRAVEALNQKNYESALFDLEALDGYKDSEELIQRAQEMRTKDRYQEAMEYFQNCYFEKAYSIFSSIHNYKDSSDRLEEIEKLTNIKYTKYDVLNALIDGSFEQYTNPGGHDMTWEKKPSMKRAGRPDIYSAISVANMADILSFMVDNNAVENRDDIKPEEWATALKFIAFSEKELAAYIAVGVQIEGFENYTVDEAANKISSLSNLEKKRFQARLSSIFDKSTFSESYLNEFVTCLYIRDDVDEKVCYFEELDLKSKGTGTIKMDVMLNENETLSLEFIKRCLNGITEVTVTNNSTRETSTRVIR